MEHIVLGHTTIIE